MPHQICRSDRVEEKGREPMRTPADAETDGWTVMDDDAVRPAHTATGVRQQRPHIIVASSINELSLMIRKISTYLIVGAACVK
ncbi:hypothetical protein Aduo_018137 [Ancylostoma duodenale]